MYPTNEEITSIIKYFDVLFKDFSLKEVTSSWSTYCKWYEKTQARYNCGATKIVFDEILEDWVVKINKPFGDDYHSDDYCYLEAINYKMACENDLSGFFAETYIIDYFSEATVIVQRRADVNEGESIASNAFFDSARESYEPYNEDETSEDRLYNISENADDLDDDERLYAIFGCDSLVNKLVNFVLKYHINDLHEGNYGTIDGEIVIVDFSGY